MWPNWVDGLGMVFQWNNILLMAMATVIGVLIGVLPGLGPTFALALFLPLTFTLSDSSSLVFLVALYSSTVYGGAISAILLNVPGTPGSVATCFDGHPLARQGKAGLALAGVTFASSISGIIGVLGLIFTAPLLAKVSLMLGPSEFFMLALMGLSLVAVASRGDTLRGLVMGGLGLLLSFIGRDVVSGTMRFTFGSSTLQNGIGFVPVSIGVFAIAQAFVMAEEGGVISQEIMDVTKGVGAGLKAVVKNWVVVLRSAVVGLIVGIMPGIGISISNFVAYLMEKRLSKDPDSYGKGNIRGVLAPESANKATVAGELVPAFALGIPGGSTSALFVIALTIHGLRPGADLFNSNPVLMSTVYWALLIGEVSYLVVGLFFAKWMAKVTRVPNSILVPIILILSILGALSYENSLSDVVVAIIFGVIGYILNKRKYPVACLVLGMVLGQLAESNFQRALLISDGSYATFLTRPLSLVFFLIIVVALVLPPVLKKLGKKFSLQQMLKS